MTHSYSPRGHQQLAPMAASHTPPRLYASSHDLPFTLNGNHARPTLLLSALGTHPTHIARRRQTLRLSSKPTGIPPGWSIDLQSPRPAPLNSTLPTKGAVPISGAERSLPAFQNAPFKEKPIVRDERRDPIHGVIRDEVTRPTRMTTTARDTFDWKWEAPRAAATRHISSVVLG